MKRPLSGSLAHLSPPVLLRLLSATGPSGVLEIASGAGSMRLDIVKGRVVVPAADELRQIGRVLGSADGTFRFTPGDVGPLGVNRITLASLVESAEAAEAVWVAALDGDVEVERLLTGEIAQLIRPAPVADIHVLPSRASDNPLDELLDDLDQATSSELLLTDVAVLSQDPRVWRGSLATRWRRRGWEIRLAASPADLALEGADAVVLHQEGTLRDESDWIDLIRRAVEASPSLPVVWVGRASDRAWVHRMIEAGVGFLMPPPDGRSTSALERFAADLEVVLDRQLAARQALAAGGGSRSLYELVDTLLEDVGPDEAVSALLQLAASQLSRGAVLMVSETGIRCRAGYGYPLGRAPASLPRGNPLLERVIAGGEPALGIDAAGAGAVELARHLGLERLPTATVLIPLTVGVRVVALLVADREGAPLPELSEMTTLACCLGGVVVRG